MGAALDAGLDVVRVASVARAAVPNVAADWRPDDVLEDDERAAALVEDVAREFDAADRAPAPALGLAGFCFDGLVAAASAAGV